MKLSAVARFRDIRSAALLVAVGLGDVESVGAISFALVGGLKDTPPAVGGGIGLGTFVVLSVG